MIEHLFSHLVSRKVEGGVEGWVKAGQRTGPVPSPDGNACRLAFGLRYRLQSLLCCFVFGAAFGAYCWLQLADPQIDVWLTIAYFGFILPVFLVSILHALSACTTRVRLCSEALDFRRLGWGWRHIEWSEVAAVYRSSVTPTIVLVAKDGRRVRISTQLDGVGALPEYLSYATPGVVHPSVVDWMLTLR